MSVVKRKKVFDNHSHIGPVPGFAYYGLPQAVKPTTDYDTTDAYLKGMDGHGVDRALVMANYGYPDSAQPFTLNPLVGESVQSTDRLFSASYGYRRFLKIRSGRPRRSSSSAKRDSSASRRPASSAARSTPGSGSPRPRRYGR